VVSLVSDSLILVVSAFLASLSEAEGELKTVVFSPEKTKHKKRGRSRTRAPVRSVYPAEERRKFETRDNPRLSHYKEAVLLKDSHTSVPTTSQGTTRNDSMEFL